MRWPTLSIKNPLATGAINPDVEKPSASIENAAGRLPGSDMMPTRFCIVI